MHEETNEERPAPGEAPAAQDAPADAPVGTEPTRKPRVVALLNQKGGVGKTTSTVNLGAALARYGQRVLLLDLDPQSNLSLHFGVESGPEQRTIRDLLLDPTCAVADCVQTARQNLDFIPAVTELALVEGELAQQEGMQAVLRSKLEPAYGNYDVVLLDCPPSLGVLSVNALTVADEVFVPMQAHYLPLRGLEKLLQTVHLIAQGLNPSIRVTGILLCMHDGSSSHARAVIGEIESQLEQFRAADVPWSGATVLDPPVRRNIKLAEAPSFGKTIFDYAPRCPGADDYRRIVLGLLERWGLPHGAFDGTAPRRERAAEDRPVRRTKAAARGARTTASKSRATVRTGAKAGATPGRPAKAQARVKKASRAKPASAAKAGKAAKPAKSAKPAKLVKSGLPGKRAKPATLAKRATPGRPACTVRVSKRGAAPGRKLRSGGLSL